MQRKKSLHNFKILYLLFMLIASGCGTLSRYKEIKPKRIEEIEIKKALPELRKGEKLTYEVYWKVIPVGIVTAEVKDIVEIEGKMAYHFIGTARSNKWLNIFFKVDDYVESFLDKENLLSIKHIAIRNEGRYHAHMVSEYNWQEKILRFRNLVDGTDKEFPLPSKAVDELSAFYYFRMQEITPGNPLEFVVNQAEKNWLVKIGITSFGKMNISGVGVFDSFVVEPQLYLGNKFFNKGKAFVYVSNDEKRIPLMVKIDVDIPIIGSILAILRKAE